ncbi:glycosyltransferase family 2 protein [uncultured Fusobacterium sp.]|uniref:glycosyltransferase family 2 protein n=1 Tax=uncultured Fusobacterium sp. TaxID=159267 RepID=UPI0025CC2428|nr:glycosyltransferase family 2 protein [uncultured Fusobacterium sp.]
MRYKFSIIIPCYNIEKYISKTLKNVLAQTFQNFEIILINDGSEDNTGKILDSYSNKDNRIRVIHKENEGVSEARNVGIKNAKGEYIYFLDGDDLIENTFLERANEVLKNNKIEIFSFGFNMIFENGKIKRKYSSEKYDNKIIRSKKFLSLFFNKKVGQNMCSFIVKKDIIENKIFFTKGLERGEDLEFQIKMLLRDVNLFYDKTPFFKYVSRNGSVVQSKVKLNIFNFLEVLEKFRKEIKDENLKKDLEYFFITYYFYTIKEMAIKGYTEETYNQAILILKKYEYILNKLKFNFSMNYLKMKILIIVYKISLKFLMFILKNILYKN